MFIPERGAVEGTNGEGCGLNHDLLFERQRHGPISRDRGGGLFIKPFA